MASKESAREDGIDFVSICTPNATHFPIAKEFLEADINVVCEKPLTVDESEAKELAALAKEKNLLCGHLRLFRLCNGQTCQRNGT